MKYMKIKNVIKFICSLCEASILLSYLLLYGFKGMPGNNVLILVHTGLILNFTIEMEKYRVKDKFLEGDIFRLFYSLILNFIFLVFSLLVWNGIGNGIDTILSFFT